MRTTTATIYDDNDDPIEVTAEYTWGKPGERVGGRKMEPDDPPEMNILDATDVSGDSITLTLTQEFKVLPALWETLC